MKIKVELRETEGFATAVALVLPDGTSLRTEGSMVWNGKAFRVKAVAAVRNLLETLEAAGVEVENKALLDEV